MDVLSELFSGMFLTYLLAALLIFGGGVSIGRTRSPKEGGFWTNVFKSNSELDSTIRYVGVIILALFMVYFFHDDIKAEAGIIIVSLFGVLTNRGNSNGNGGHE